MKLALVNRDLLLQNSNAIYHRSQIQINSESIQAIYQLNQAGYTVVVLTQQPGISRGLLDLEELEAIHEILTGAAEATGAFISAIFYCPHEAEDNCYCRPPRQGLLDVIEMEFDCDCASAVYFYLTDSEKIMIESKRMRGVKCDNEQQGLLPQLTLFLKG